MFLQTICTVCDGPFAAKDKKLKRNSDKKEIHQKGIICRVAIPYELKDDILGGDKDENWPQFDAVTLWAKIKG